MGALIAAAVLTLAGGSAYLYARRRRPSSARSSSSSSRAREDARLVEVDARQDIAAYNAQIAALEKAPLDTAKLGADLGGNFGVIGAAIGFVAGFFVGGIYAIAQRAPKNVRSVVRDKVERAIRAEGEEVTDERVLYGMHTAALVMLHVPVGIDADGNLIVRYPQGFSTAHNATREFLQSWFWDPVWEYAAESHDGTPRIRRTRVGDFLHSQEVEETYYVPREGFYRILVAESRRGLEDDREAVLQLVAEPAAPSDVVVWSVPAQHHGMVAFHLERLGQELGA